MIPKNLLEKTDIVVSYGIMQGAGTNSMGHAYLLFSYYCPDSKQMIVNDAIGLYSTPLPLENSWRRKLSSLSFFDKGHLLQEKYRYLISNGTTNMMHHYHKSWKVSSEQYLAIMKEIDADRGKIYPLVDRNFAQEHLEHMNIKNLNPEEKKCSLELSKSKEDAEHLNAGGPRFDIIKNSCKTDALKRLAKVGIDTAGIHNRLIDLPIYSGKISEHTLDFDEEINKLVWKTPLELSPQVAYDKENPEMQATILAQRQYHLIMNNLKGMINLFALKIHDLEQKPTQEKSKILIKNTLADLIKLQDDMITEGLDPKKITHANVTEYFKSYHLIISKAKKELTPNLQDKNLKLFIQKMLDKIIDLCVQFGSLFSTPNVVIYSEGYLIQKAENKVNRLEPRLKASA